MNKTAPSAVGGGSAGSADEERSKPFNNLSRTICASSRPNRTLVASSRRRCPAAAIPSPQSSNLWRYTCAAPCPRFPT